MFNFTEILRKGDIFKKLTDVEVLIHNVQFTTFKVCSRIIESSEQP